jgi:DNA repair exonuclease SbcCD nuclease subunit
MLAQNNHKYRIAGVDLSSPCLHIARKKQIYASLSFHQKVFSFSLRFGLIKWRALVFAAKNHYSYTYYGKSPIFRVLMRSCSLIRRGFMFKFIHIADIHLDSPLVGLERYEGAPVERIRCATRQALQNLTDLAIREKVRFVLICGDLYDGEWKDYNTGLFLVKEMARLREADIEVFIVSGNHDAESRITKSLKMPENVCWFSAKRPETRIIEDLSVAIHGQGFSKRAVMENLSLGYPGAISGCFNIGILHTSVNGREGHESYAPCSRGDLIAKGYDYWALGHVHKREIVDKDPWIIFPGNIQGRHIRETGGKGCTLVTVENGGSVFVEHHDLDVVRWETCAIDASGSDTPEDIIERARAEIKEKIDNNNGRFLALRVRIDGSCKAHNELLMDPEKWKMELRAMATDESSGSVWIEKIKMDTRTPMDLRELMRRKGPIGDLLVFINEISSEKEGHVEPGEDILELKRQIAVEFNRLQSKLPSEIRRGDKWLDLEDPEDFHNLLNAARQLLISRLLSRGDIS